VTEGRREASTLVNPLGQPRKKGSVFYFFNFLKL
jgi:hypothetical protein